MIRTSIYGCFPLRNLPGGRTTVDMLIQNARKTTFTIHLHMGVEPKNRGVSPNMDDENNGKHPIF